MNKRRILFSIVLSLGTMVFIAFTVGSRKVLADLEDLNPRCLIALALDVLAILVVDGLRTKLILKKVPFGVCVKNSVWGFYASALTPFAAGGQPFQIYHLVMSGVDFGEASSAIALRFFCSFTFTVLSGFVFFLVYFDLFQRMGLIGGVFTVGVVFAFSVYTFVLFLLFNRRVLRATFGSRFVLRILSLFSRRSLEESKALLEERVGAYLERIREFLKNRKWDFFVLFLMSASMMVMIHLVSYLSLKAVDPKLSLSVFEMVSLQLAASMVVYFSPTPGASGTSELVYYIVYSSFEEGGYVTASMFLWKFFTNYVFLLLGTFLGMMALVRKEKNRR